MDPGAFGIIANWFYRKSVPVALSWTEYDMLVKAYGIADRLLMTKCQENILQRIKGFCLENKLQPHNSHVVAELGLSTESGISQFVADQLAKACIWAITMFVSRRVLNEMQYETKRNVAVSGWPFCRCSLRARYQFTYATLDNSTHSNTPTLSRVTSCQSTSELRFWPLQSSPCVMFQYQGVYGQVQATSCVHLCRFLRVSYCLFLCFNITFTLFLRAN